MSTSRTTMGDVIVYSVCAALSAVVAAAAFTARLGARAAADALEEAQPIDVSSDGNDPGSNGDFPNVTRSGATVAPLASVARVVHNGAWVLATGTVKCEHPLRSMNGEAAAVLQDTLMSHEIRADRSGSVQRAKLILDRTWREADWEIETRKHFLAVDSAGVSTSINSAAVERDAVRRAFERAPQLAISGLTNAGMELVPRSRPWYVGALKLLWGVIDEETVRVHEIVPVGHFFSIAALATVIDGRLILGTHPSLGFFLTRDVRAVITSLRTREWLATAAGLVSGGLAIFLLRSALQSYHALGIAANSVHPAQSGSIDSSRASADAASSGRSSRAEPAPENVDSPASGTGDDECVACTTNRRIAVFTPCGHLCCCMACAMLLVSSPPTARRCPLCRDHIESAVRVFGLAT